MDPDQSGSSTPWPASTTILTPYGYNVGSCGYCKNSETSERTPNSRWSYYAKAEALSVEHYQILLERGWRRSGTTLYKPDQKRSCCPHYTIRLPVAEFKPSKSQKQVLHRWNRFVLGDQYSKEAARLHPKSRDEKRKSRTEFDFLATIHESESANLQTPPEPAHRVSITLESNEFTEEKYALFENYQRTVHKEPPSDITRKGFRSFLCKSPLPTPSSPSSSTHRPLGSFHQCYRIDNQLFALAVLDLLPNTISSVYFLYHSAYEHWSLGKLSAMREIALARALGRDYYSMGYYIHVCAKMKYKAEFKPQYLLDPESYAWDELDGGLMRRLDEDAYVSLSADERRRRATEDAAASNGTAAAQNHPIQPSRHISLFSLGMPGVMTAAEVLAQINLDEIRLMLTLADETVVEIAPTRFAAWKGSKPEEHATIKGAVAELAACVGVRVAREMVVFI